ncbi:hypothetical protein GIB67_009095 [Kingdonia uniflora]|uniref:ABC transporter domain-containing protein n=1 Tax=Kingdonia uniflora TaxID=39325 RepID=A0A7J7N3P5_9MAGN|nr:hypothetical protein GIB67_009095 [Kingdonia uniflora]
MKYFFEDFSAGERILEVIKRVPKIDSDNMEVGGSGSRKSMVIALLQRFYDPRAGEIALDGAEICKLQIKWLRSEMGLVGQEPCLFATIIKENILFGKEDATMDAVVNATKALNAHNCISQIPQGYDAQALQVEREERRKDLDQQSRTHQKEMENLRRTHNRLTGSQTSPPQARSDHRSRATHRDDQPREGRVRTSRSRSRNPKIQIGLLETLDLHP